MVSNFNLLLGKTHFFDKTINSWKKLKLEKEGL